MLASVALPPAWLAAVLLLARAVADRYELAYPSVDAIVKATGASKSHAYEVVGTLAALLPTLVRAPGRPARQEPAPSSNAAADVTRAVLAYVMSHPGCVDRGAKRQRYNAEFRRFVLGLRATHASLQLELFADSVGVPIGTLKDWLGETPPKALEVESPAPSLATSDLESLHIQTVLDAWARWEGSFVGFCEHVHGDLRVPFGRDLVGRILHTHGQRTPARRQGRSPDESALRGAFRTYFPGAQWVGDGMQVPVVVDGHRFVFNVELDVDAYAGAFVGASVRNDEDSAAVVEAFSDAVVTTGAPPLALLLDNKPSNHTTDVDDALGATLRIRATLERPQNKGCASYCTSWAGSSVGCFVAAKGRGLMLVFYWSVLLGSLEEAPPAIIKSVTYDESGTSPDPDRGRIDVEVLGHLVQVEQTARTQAIVSALESVRFANLGDEVAMEAMTFA